MAAIEPYQTKDGRRYRVIYRTPERKQTSKRGFRTKMDAELFLASVAVSKARGEFIDAAAARVTVGELGPAWLKRQTHLKPSSFRPIEAAWRNHVEPVWGGKAVSESERRRYRTGSPD